MPMWMTSGYRDHITGAHDLLATGIRNDTKPLGCDQNLIDLVTMHPVALAGLKADRIDFDLIRVRRARQKRKANAVSDIEVARGFVVGLGRGLQDFHSFIC